MIGEALSYFASKDGGAPVPLLEEPLAIVQVKASNAVAMYPCDPNGKFSHQPCADNGGQPRGNAHLYMHWRIPNICQCSVIAASLRGL